MTTTRILDANRTNGTQTHCAGCGRPVLRRRVTAIAKCDECAREANRQYDRRRRAGIKPVVRGPYKRRASKYTDTLTAGTVLVYHAGYRARVVFEYEQYPIEEIRASLAADALPDGVTFHAVRGDDDLGYWRAECGGLVEVQP
jgi:ribosomal protein L37AE/L43A